MKSVLNELLERAKCENKEVREEAILQIAMLLEKNSICPDQPSFYETVLSDHLLSISLDESEQQEMIAELGNLILSEKMTASMLWALGKTTSRTALVPLLTWLRNHNRSLDEEAIWQALIALDNFLGLKVDGTLDCQVADMIRDYNLTSALQRILETDNPRLKKLGQKLLNRIQR